MNTLPITNVVVRNTGDVDTERLVFVATEDFNVGHILVADNTYDKNAKPTNKQRHTYAFPSKEVKKGEFVVLWTQAGSNNDGKAADKKTPQHNFFWGLNTTVWNVTGDVAHLIDVRQVEHYAVPPKQ